MNPISSDVQFCRLWENNSSCKGLQLWRRDSLQSLHHCRWSRGGVVKGNDACFPRGSALAKRKEAHKDAVTTRTDRTPGRARYNLERRIPKGGRVLVGLWLEHCDVASPTGREGFALRWRVQPEPPVRPDRRGHVSCVAFLHHHQLASENSRVALSNVPNRPRPHKRGVVAATREAEQTLVRNTQRIVAAGADVGRSIGC